MNGDPLFYVDSVLILRVFGGLSFGFAYAAVLQFTDLGKYLADQLTWASVVIGMTGVMLLSWPADWYTVALVLAAASVGIILRSLLLDSRGRKRDDTIFRSHKTKNGIDDAMVSIVTAWGLALDGAKDAPPQYGVIFNQILTLLETARAHLAAARRGEEWTVPVDMKRVIK